MPSAITKYGSIDSILQNPPKSNSFSKKTLENSSERANDGENSNMRSSYSKVDAKITPGMTDVERYEILKKREIKLSAVVNVDEEIKTNIEALDAVQGNEKKKLIKKLASEFGVFQKYTNEDIDINFEFSKNNFDESFQKQKRNYKIFAKMFSVFDTVIENAVGIEVHNRNETYKTDPTLKNVYVLASAFVDGEEIIPVKLEVKEFRDKENTLYVAIALESINKDGIVKVRDAEGVAQIFPPSSISISEYFKKINPSDESFYKYIPKPFLSEEKNNENDNMRFSKIKAATFTHRDVNEMLSTVRNEALTFTLEDGTEVKGEIPRRDGWDIDKWLYDTLNTANLKDKRALARQIADQILDVAITEGGQSFLQ